MELSSPIKPPTNTACCAFAYFKTIADPTIPATVRKKPIEDRMMPKIPRAYVYSGKAEYDKL